MNVLGIDGALGAFSAAVTADDAVLACAAESGNVALEAGLAIVSRALTGAQITPQKLTRVAVGSGPGGFTGLRIALSYAKALAQAWGLPLVPVDSFDLLEHGQTFERVLTVVEGRPGVISARLRLGGRTARASGWIADVLDRLAPPKGEPLTVLGASKDVLCALADRAVVVIPASPSVLNPASAAALAAAAREPAPNVHAVCADYGELAAARVPRLR
jgi:tRNA threonylcarbamoyladenosine biosynthesis protein TsaB